MDVSFHEETPLCYTKRKHVGFKDSRTNAVFSACRQTSTEKPPFYLPRGRSSL